MQADANLAAGSTLSGEALLLWIAVALAVVFLAVLALDFIKRRKPSRRKRHREPEGFQTRLLKPLHRVQALWAELAQLLHERSRRHNRKRTRHPEELP